MMTLTWTCLKKKMKTKRCRCFHPRKITKLINNNFPKVHQVAKTEGNLRHLNTAKEKTKRVNPKEVQSRLVVVATMKTNTVDGVKGGKVVVVQGIEVNVLTVGEADDPGRDLDPGQNQGTDTEGIEIIGQVEDTVTKTKITAITTTREAVNFNLLA